MPDPAPHPEKPTRIGNQSGGSTPAGEETASDPKSDPSAAGADLYNSGNKTGNPVTSGTPGVAEQGRGKGEVKKTPTVEHEA